MTRLLPFPFVSTGLLILFTAPDYMSKMFSDPRGNVMLMISAGVMALGIFVMRKMINFDF